MEGSAVTEVERDELVRDLERAGMRIVAIEPRPFYAGEWQIRVWSRRTTVEHVIADAVLFRQVVRAGLTPVLARGALDQR
jgi:hypothetical protein